MKFTLFFKFVELNDSLAHFKFKKELILDLESIYFLNSSFEILLVDSFFKKKLFIKVSILQLHSPVKFLINTNSTSQFISLQIISFEICPKNNTLSCNAICHSLSPFTKNSSNFRNVKGGIIIFLPSFNLKNIKRIKL